MRTNNSNTQIRAATIQATWATSLTVELARVGRDLQRDEVPMHEVLAILACVSSSSIVHDDLLLSTVSRQHGLLQVVEERHEVLLVRRASQLHEAPLLQASANRSNHSHPHLPSIANVELRVVLLRPALLLALH